MILASDRITIKCTTKKCFFSPCGKWFAVGGADAIVSIWDAYEYIPVRTISRLEWPVRTLSFSHNGKLLAAASEDHVIDISHVSHFIKKWGAYPRWLASLYYPRGIRTIGKIYPTLHRGSFMNCTRRIDPRLA